MVKSLARAVVANVLLFGAVPAGAQTPPPAGAEATVRPAPVNQLQGLILVRSTLIALHQANVTGNYTVLRDLGAPRFRDSFDAAQLAASFAEQRNRRYFLAGVLVVDPVFTAPPVVADDGLLRLAGYFPSGPMRLRFELSFELVGAEWRVAGIEVGIEDAAAN